MYLSDYHLFTFVAVEECNVCMGSLLVMHNNVTWCVSQCTRVRNLFVYKSPICDLFCHALVSSLSMHNCGRFPLPSPDYFPYMYTYCIVCTLKAQVCAHVMCMNCVYFRCMCMWLGYMRILLYCPLRIAISIFTWFCVMATHRLAAKKCMAGWSTSPHEANGMSYILCTSSLVYAVHVCVCVCWTMHIHCTWSNILCSLCVLTLRAMMCSSTAQGW